jgi:hypothetical protein
LISGQYPLTQRPVRLLGYVSIIFLISGDVVMTKVVFNGTKLSFNYLLISGAPTYPVTVANVSGFQLSFDVW